MQTTINAKFTIATRLALIVVSPFAPILLLIYLFLQQSLGDILFANKEIAGTQISR